MARRFHWWFAFSAGVLVSYSLVAAAAPAHVRSIFADVAPLLLTALAAAIMISNAGRSRGRTRAFWALLSAGCWLWVINEFLWVYYEVLLSKSVPDLSIADVALFVHVVPFMAAAAMRPHREQAEHREHFDTLNSLLLLLWWVFLYVFLIYPNQYLWRDFNEYNARYDALYLFENLILLGGYLLLAIRAQGGWRTVYRNFFVASLIYTSSSYLINFFSLRDAYSSGSLYDLPYLLAVLWFVWLAVQARQLKLEPEPAPEQSAYEGVLAARLAHLAILSMPLLALWALTLDTSPWPMRRFRLIVTAAGILVLGLVVFLKQFLLDRELIRLLAATRESVEQQKRLQNELVQQEKLASLGQLAAGAAHEINNPLTVILGYAEMLENQLSSQPEQARLARRIGQQARRTHDLVSGLLGFARQAVAEKTNLNLASLVRRVLDTQAVRPEEGEVRFQVDLPNNLPPVWGNEDQLFRVCRHIVGNAVDALRSSGGLVTVSARELEGRLIVEFADNGPGLTDPQRVFDPFYTTKAVGQGTGLGLSFCYGVVLDHSGEIACRNRPEGGAIFVLTLPIAPAAVISS